MSTVVGSEAHTGSRLLGPGSGTPRLSRACRVRLVVLFLAIAVGFVWYRHVPYLIWNDTSVVFAGQDPKEWLQGVDSRQASLSVHPWHTLARMVPATFGTLQGDGYRPVASLGCQVSFWLFYDPRGPTFFHLLLVGGVYGATAVCVFATARRFVRHEITAFFATFLVLASPPFLAGTWVFMAGVQATVPLLICLGLLCYWRTLEPGRHWLAYTGLLVILVLGPWYREFLGIVPILIGFLELQRMRRPTLQLFIATVALMHAVYPTAFLKLICFHDLPLKPVNQLGNLASSLDMGGLRWHAPWHFLPLFPPLLLVLGVAYAQFESWRRIGQIVGRREGDTWSGWSLVISLGSIAWLVLVLGMTGWHSHSRFFGLLLCLGLAAIGLQRNIFLAFWFLVSFLPMLRVFTLHIHYLYAMLPAAIILAGTVEQLWLQLGPGRTLVWARYALAGVLLVVIADETMNFYGVYRVNRATYEGIQEVAQWFKQNTPAHSYVISNVIHGEDIKWYSGNHFENFWTIKWGVLDPNRIVNQPEQLRQLWKGRGSRPIYLLDVDFDYLPCMSADHRNLFVHRLHVPLREVGLVHHTHGHYPFVDPLRYLVPRDYVPFLGAPDLAPDFYCGRARNGRPFSYEVYADYRVYRLEGDDIELEPTSAE